MILPRGSWWWSKRRSSNPSASSIVDLACGWSQFPLLWFAGVPRRPFLCKEVLVCEHLPRGASFRFDYFSKRKKDADMDTNTTGTSTISSLH
jgi:hypothetical protein